MKNFIVPVDFSAQSLNAALYAVSFAEGIGGSVTLIHVCQAPVSVNEIPVPDAIVNVIEKDAEKEMAALKDELLSKTAGGVKIYTEIKEGSIIAELMLAAKAIQPAAVIMGTHGRGNLERLLFGSNTLLAAKNLSCPVIVIPAGAKFRPIKKIGLASDFRNVINATPAGAIKQFISLLNAKLFILHVSPEKSNQPLAEEIEQSAWVNEIFNDVHPEFHFIHHDNIEKGLNEFMLKNDVDLLLIVPKSHSFADSLLHKTHLKDFILNAQVPLVSIHA
jgi:nucleotide-binding universal stress UspA family protein